MVEGVQTGVNERKLCPICGEAGIMQVFRASGEPTPRYRVKCGGCWCMTDWENFTAQEAEKKWNQRAEHKPGRWIPGEYDGYADGNPVYDTAICSECFEEFDFEQAENQYNFCPNCGADMREEVKDGD